jgi:hypothetical protein
MKKALHAADAVKQSASSPECINETSLCQIASKTNIFIFTLIIFSLQ